MKPCKRSFIYSFVYNVFFSLLLNNVVFLQQNLPTPVQNDPLGPLPSGWGESSISILLRIQYIDVVCFSKTRVYVCFQIGQETILLLINDIHESIAVRFHPFHLGSWNWKNLGSVSVFSKEEQFKPFA